MGEWEGGVRMSKWVRGGMRRGEMGCGEGSGGWGWEWMGWCKGKRRDGECVKRRGVGYFADVLSYWLVQMLGEGQSQTILSPAVVGKRAVKQREGGRGGGGGRYVF